MASISSLSSSGTSSLYNSANIISGLASGMDTEGMIESLVQSYQNKIQSLNNQVTKIQWKQESYRNIIAKMTGFSSKYASYTSSTNLLSAGFFNSAVKVAALGKNGEKVTASGRSDSNIVLNGVSQLATAARFTTKAPGLKADGGTNITAGGFKDTEGNPLESLDLDSNVTLSNLTGSMSFMYGSKTVSISFDEINDRIGVDENGKDLGLTDKEKADQVAKLIEEKLGDQKITLSNGESVSASDRIGVTVESDGTIKFSDKSGAGNKVYIADASDSIKNTLGLGDMDDKDNPVKSAKVSGPLTRDVKAYQYLSGKSININVDGVSKTIQMPRITQNEDDTFTLTMPSTVKDKYGNISYVYDNGKLDTSRYTVIKKGDTAEASDVKGIADAYTDMLKKSVKSAFGDKLEVDNIATNEGGLKLDFKVKEGSNLVINTSVGQTLGIGRSATNYLNTGSTLGDLMQDGALDSLTPVGKDEKGNDLYEFKINDVVIGQYSKNSKLSDIISDINSNTEAGVKASYSKTTRQFVFTSKETGSGNEIDISGGLAEAIFGTSKVSETSSGTFGEAYGYPWMNNNRVYFQIPGISGDISFKVGKNATIEDVADSLNEQVFNYGYTAAYNKYTGQLEVTNDTSGEKVDMEIWLEDGFGKRDLTFNKDYAPKVDYTPGQDAKFKVTVDGVEKNLVRGSNSVEIDGMTINFNETFNEDYSGGAAENVTFKSTTDADKIVDAVKSMITDYNEMMSEIRKAYATMPYQDSTGAIKSYEPLTEDEMAGMSEAAIERYEEKAKQGILFGDSNLRTLYERMRDVFQPSGMDSALLSKIGITSSFSTTDNSTTIVLDESKFRAALESNPDEVTDLFTRTSENGASSNGIMQGLKTQLDRYGGLTGATKGILVQQAGTPLNSLSLLDNQWQKQIDNLGTQIEKWQDKLESQVDRYTSMFSKLEVLINQMNSQSSTLAGLMGGQ